MSYKNNHSRAVGGNVTEAGGVFASARVYFCCKGEHFNTTLGFWTYQSSSLQVQSPLCMFLFRFLCRLSSWRSPLSQPFQCLNSELCPCCRGNSSASGFLAFQETFLKFSRLTAASFSWKRFQWHHQRDTDNSVHVFLHVITPSVICSLKCPMYEKQILCVLFLVVLPSWC